MPSLVDEALSRMVQVRMGGRTVSMSQREALVRSYLDRALKGDIKALAVVLKLDPKAKASEADRTDEAVSEAISAEERALLLNFLQRDQSGDGGESC